MNKDTLIEVVDKLTGCCSPAGDTSIDEKRYENLELKIALVAYLIEEIEEAGNLYDRCEFSIQHIANRANDFLTNIRDSLLYIEYLPPFEPIDSKMTNEQRIKRLDTEEFAEYLFDRGNCTEHCYGICAHQNECDEEVYAREFCIEQICKWLESEVTE